MARTVAVQYVGGHDSVDMPTLGISVKRDGVIEVSADVAGHEAGQWHPVGEGDDPDWPTYLDGETTYTKDPGSGLLAQPDNWLPVKANPAKSTAAPVVTPEA
jgi:hypothetical protein